MSTLCPKENHLMSTDLLPNKPEPSVLDKTQRTFSSGTNIASTIGFLEEGKMILISELYSDGLALLQAVTKHLKRKLPNDSFRDQQAYRTAYYTLSNRVVLEIKDHQLSAKKAPSIGWFKLLYPDNDHFYLTMPQVQGMNSAWQWYKNGVSIPVLRNKVHPYYGTYFPSRYEHLEIFDNWLKRYKGPKKTAIDVGVGCGVLSLQMIQHGFQKVFATDINPNAIVGLTEFMGDTKLSRKLELDLGNLFGKWDQPTELIVFNPPWLPQSHDFGGLDAAMYYTETLFPDFFAAAKERLLPDGKLLVIFSNLGKLANLRTEHPIEQELKEGGRFSLERCFKKSVRKASTKTKREQLLRSNEEVELWVLAHK